MEKPGSETGVGMGVRGVGGWEWCLEFSWSGLLLVRARKEA